MSIAVSISQLESWECKRKWAFQRLERYAQNFYAWRGEQGHRLLEDWGMNGTPPAGARDRIAIDLCREMPDSIAELAEQGLSPYDYADRIVIAAQKSIEHLPPPPWPHTEHEMRFIAGGVEWAGRLDLLAPLLAGGQIDTVFDHKFVGSSKHALDKDTIKSAPQPTVYAKYLLLQQPALQHVNQQWTYSIIGAKPRAWKVSNTASAQEIEDEFGTINERAKEIVSLRILHNHTDPDRRNHLPIDPLQLPPNPLVCPRFGGCAYQNTRCILTPAQLMAAVFDEEKPQETPTMPGLLEELKNKDGSPAVPNGASTAGARSDTAAVEADCRAEAEKLKAAGIVGDLLVTVLAAKFVGLGKEGVERALNPPPSPPEPANGSSVNPQPFAMPPTEADKPVEGKGNKGGRKGKGAEEATAAGNAVYLTADELRSLFRHVAKQIAGETQAEVAAAALHDLAGALSCLLAR